MDEQQLIEQPLTICSFFRRLLYRFSNGNAPYIPDCDSCRIPNNFPFSFPFDCHPGPIEDALVDARNMHCFLLVFIFNRDNPMSHNAISILQRQEVADEFRNGWIFLPLEVTWPEGWRVAAILEFRVMPLIALVRPRRVSLTSCKICGRCEGRISQAMLLSAMRAARPSRVRPVTEPVTHEEGDVCVEGDVSNDEQERRQVDKAYEALMMQQGGETATVRFQFQDGTVQTHKFARDGAVKGLFVFVRKFMYPKSFRLLTGFPRSVLEESEQELRHECKGTQFIVYVEEV